VAVVIRTRTRPLLAHNVVALLRGGDPARRGEIVAYTAHHDHLGIGEPDARGDTIYNGFTDNAAGCAALLAIAQALVARRPARSALFVFFTGEERGLLGSDWFVAHPPMPLAALAAVINLDAGAPPGRPVRWHVTGGDRSTGARRLRRAVARLLECAAPAVGPLPRAGRRVVGRLPVRGAGAVRGVRAAAGPRAQRGRAAASGAMISGCCPVAARTAAGPCGDRDR
jgi:hypothetical protein